MVGKKVVMGVTGVVIILFVIAHMLGNLKIYSNFAEHYVATSVLAKRFHLNSGSLARHLKESGTRLLAIPLADFGWRHAFFLRKDVAAQIQLPSRRMLREEAQRRIKVARKKKWAEYRLAREISLGKPMRRVRANCRQPGTLGLSQEYSQ